MAHFANVENGIVNKVIVVENDICGDSFPESELIGQSFISSIGIEGVWLQTSYNKNFRGKFAGKGMMYSSEKDCFYGPSPFDSWVLDSSGDWKSPIPYPSDGKEYYWNEVSQSWDLLAD